jgi:hypothetical protein
MQKIVLQLPVPRYLKKILDSKYGDSYTAKEYCLFGMTVINILKRKSDRDYESIRKKHFQNYRFKDVNEYFFVTINLDKARHNGYEITQKRAYQIVRAIDRDVRENLYLSAIFNKLHYGIEYQSTILNFLDFYDITEEELSYESIRKDFNRKRKSLLEKLNINV